MERQRHSFEAPKNLLDAIRQASGRVGVSGVPVNQWIREACFEKIKIDHPELAKELKGGKK